MILKYFLLTTTLQVVSCINLASELYPNGKFSMNQRKCPFNSDFVGLSNIASTHTDKTTSVYENYFPDVIYPTCILDIGEPFYYAANGYDEVLGPFDDDVKSAYKCISSNNKKTKTNNLPKMFEDDKVKCVSVTTSSLSNKNNTLERNEPKSIVYSNEESEDICRQYNDSTCSEETITSYEDNAIETHGYGEFNDISLTSSLYSLRNESETDMQDCDTIASLEYKNLTSNIYNSSNDLAETKNKNTISDEHHVRIKVKIIIEVSNVPGEHNVNTSRDKLNIFPYEILEFISSGENETFLDKGKNICSAEEIRVFPEDILNILLNSSNHTDLVFTELLLELLSESSEKSEIFYPFLQLLNENINITKMELPLNETICNTPDNHDYIETLEIYIERDKNTIIYDNDNTTTERLAEDVEDYEETDDGVYFLDFIVSLDTQCQMYDPILSEDLSEDKQKYISMYSDESSSEED